MRNSSWFVLIVAVFVTCLITANIIAVKLVNIFGLIVPAAVAIPLTSFVFAKRKMVEIPDGVYPVRVNRGEPPSHRAPDLLSTIGGSPQAPITTDQRNGITFSRS